MRARFRPRSTWAPRGHVSCWRFRAGLSLAAGYSLAAGPPPPVVTAHRGAPATGVADTVPGLAWADSLVRAEFARDSLAGLTVGVVSGDRLVWTVSHGLADMGTRRPASRHTVYRIGSVTKMFTGLMLQQLLAAGTVRLSDPVARFYPDIARVRGLPAGAAPVSVGQLATMTGGLAAEPAQEGAFWTGPVGRWEATLAAALPHARYEAAPGTRYAYSNLGYAVLGAALARAARTPYVDWERDRILTPLGMAHTAFEPDAALRADLARGYEIDERGVADTAGPARELREGRGYKVPNGALFTTVNDLARFVRFELGRGPDAVLPRARLDSAYAGVVATSADLDVGYGLGFMVQRRGDFTWVGHSGGVPGYAAMVYFDREHQLGVILLRNATGGRVRPNRLASDLLRGLVDAKLRAGRAERAGV